MKKSIVTVLLFFITISQTSYGMIRRILPQVATAMISVQNRLHATPLASEKDNHLDTEKNVRAHADGKQYKDVFTSHNVEYTDALILSSYIGEYTSFVFPDGISKTILPKEMQQSLSVCQAPYQKPKLEICHINDQVGFGVKALEKISKDCCIQPYAGIVGVVDHTACDSKKYALTVCGTQKQLIIDSELAGNETRFCNHRYAANSYIKPIVDEKTGLVQFWLVAAEDIQAGEEILWNYGSHYWRTHGIAPIDTQVRHIYQDKHLTMYSYPKQGRANLYINDNPVICKEIIASNHVVIGQDVFIVLVIKQGDKANSIVYNKSNDQVRFVQNVSDFCQDTQRKITECFHDALKKISLKTEKIHGK